MADTVQKPEEGTSGITLIVGGLAILLMFRGFLNETVNGLSGLGRLPRVEDEDYFDPRPHRTRIGHNERVGIHKPRARKLLKRIAVRAQRRAGKQGANAPKRRAYRRP